jgi:hypothetical protein
MSNEEVVTYTLSELKLIKQALTPILTKIDNATRKMNLRQKGMTIIWKWDEKIDPLALQNVGQLTDMFLIEQLIDQLIGELDE